MANDELKAVVRDKYGKAALKVTGGAGASCCDATARAADPITSNIYGCGETAELPAEAVAASLGCGNPTALAQLNPGEVVLDLGSGGGIDVLLRSCSTWARVAASTCCSPPGAWGRPARRTGST